MDKLLIYVFIAAVWFAWGAMFSNSLWEDKCKNSGSVKRESVIYQCKPVSPYEAKEKL